MEIFRSKFVQQCQAYQVEPLQTLLDKLDVKSKPSPDSADSHYPAELDLHGTTLATKMCKALADTIQSDEVFERLNLADTLMGDDGCVLLANALKANSTVKQIDLRGNNIRSDGAVALAQLLKVNSAIKSLFLEWNCLGVWESGINALAESLSINQTLEELDLRNNKIGPHAATQLANHLKHNSYLRKLDLRWNNIGVIGGRAFLDILKWNKTLLYLDLTGNELPEDVHRAIDLALDRNREHFRTERETSSRTQFLSSTLQKMSSDHEKSLENLRTKLLAQDTSMQSLNLKLGKASEEVDKSHMAYRMLENKLAEERAKKEMIEKKCSEMEDTLAQERRDHSERCQALLSDLMNERGNRVRQEEAYRYQISQLTEKQMVHESTVREMQLKLELFQREKVTLLEELEKLRSHQSSMQRGFDEQLKQMNNHRKEAEANYRRELREIQDDYANKVKQVETDKSKLDELAESYRAKSMEWDGRMRLMEKQIRAEENAKRQELMAKLQSLAQHRESLQQSLNAHLQTHRTSIVDYENRISREKETQQSFTSKLAQLSHERDELKNELSHLKAKGSLWDENEREWKSKLERFEEENTKLKAEATRLQRALERIREEEVSRAKELEKAVTGYVRSVERSNNNLLQA